MQSLVLLQNLQWRCLLFLFMSIRVGATLEEGAILFNWKKNLTDPGGVLSSWDGLSDPCGGTWRRILCDNNGHVARIDFGCQGLSGTLAPEIGQLSGLLTLTLCNDSLTGGIPQELGNLAALTQLDLHDNQLSGPIPESFEKLTNLTYLKLSQNRFSGSFPMLLTSLNKLPEINLDSNYISEVLNVTRILDVIEATARTYQGQSIGVVSLINNSITDIVYQPDDLQNNRVVFKLQGNPYCSGLIELYDDAKRCFCLQNCSSTPSQAGAILFNWKKQLSDPGGQLANWGNSTNPCGSNPWFHVLCDSGGNVFQLYLESSELSGTLAAELGQLSNLTTLSLYNNSFSGSIPPELGNLTALTCLNLSRNELSGPIPDSLERLTNLEYITLNNNNFSGSFPESLAKLNNLYDINLDSNFISGVLNVTRILDIIHETRDQRQLLGVVSLMNNNITNVAYKLDDLQNTRPVFKLQGNPYCSDSTKLEDDSKKCFCLQKCPSTTAGKKSQHLAIKLGTISCAVLLIIAICMGVTFKRQEKRKLCELNVEYRHKFAEFEVNPQPFLYDELRLATLNFNESTKLGRGSFGTVYKGTLSNGNKVAIKKLKPKIAAQEKVDDFLNEVVFITKMKHKNLVNLKGCCMRKKERMLVYEYVENMDVEQSLLMGKNKEAMTWSVRFNICLGVAQGLHYLHAYAEPRVIHRDIKASNVLLDINYAPKIADFGLALLFPDEKTHISTVTVAGTRGYLAPEYASYGQLSEKADVYSFGVLCLEIISGRRNTDFSKPPNQVYLLSWAWMLYEEGKLKDLIDPSLHLHSDEEMQALRVINTALLCLQQIPERRPSMSDAQTTLQGNMELNEVIFPMNDMVDSSILEASTLLSLSSIEDMYSIR